MTASDTPPRPVRRMRPTRARKAAVQIAQSIVDQITDRGYGPGTKLPTEKDMLADFSVGRGTLRESLRFLELTGILIMKAGPSGGPIVASPNGHDLAGILGLFLQLQPTTFGAIVEARELLEPAIARVAAVKATPFQLAELEASVQRMEEALADEETFLYENDQFHEAVSEAAGNPLFSLLIASLHQITDGIPLGVTYPPKRRAAVLAAHSAILDAIRAKDPAAAHDAMLRHMNEFHKYVGKRYPSVFERQLRWSDIAP